MTREVATRPAVRPRRGPTIRLRLTLLWGGLFGLFGLLLLASLYAVVVDRLAGVPDEIRAVLAEEADLPAEELAQLDDQELVVRLFEVGDAAALHDVLEEPLRRFRGKVEAATLLAVAALAVAAGAAGWFLAGRLLAPVRTITETARRISDSNLGDRIALDGPRDELHELAEAFDQMLSRLETGFDAQRTFAADASHELRTPLTLIRAELDVTLDDPSSTPEDLAETAASIRRALDQSEELIDRLLQLASAEVIHDRQPVELDDLVRHSVQTHAESAAVRIDRSLTPAVAAGDPALLASLVDNLVHNAVRHGGGDDAWLRVETASPGDGEVMLRVANGGPRLRAEEVARLTDRFYRPDPSRARATGGSGLGLAIVATIVATHGGRLLLSAREAGGLAVEVRLPGVSGSSGSDASGGSDVSGSSGG